jgi:hypothetical protein
MKFAISSHKDFFDLTHKRLLNSMVDSGVDKNDVYFFVGGHDDLENYEKVNCELNVYNVPHNSFDFTGLISVLELGLENPWWFLLHDTCYVGKNFFNRIKNYDYGNWPSIRLSCIYDSMNIGAYRWSYLQKCSHILMDYKGNNKESQKYKRKLIYREDVLLEFGPEIVCFSDVPRKEFGPIDYYGTGVLRKIYYYEKIDLYKIQSNWIPKKEDEEYILDL